MSTSDMTPINFTPSEAAQRLGLKVGSIYALISRGELLAYHQGRRRLIPSNELQRLMLKRNAVEVDMTYAFGPRLKST
jgi:excisionase family DNA binding protein